MMPAILSVCHQTMTGYTVSRDGSDVPDAATDLAEEFFDEVKNGRDEQTEVPGGYGSYPRAYVVELPSGGVYIGFATGLPEDREPWMVGFKPVTRDTVIDATSDTLDAVEGDEAELVNDLIAAADDA